MSPLDRLLTYLLDLLTRRLGPETPHRVELYDRENPMDKLSLRVAPPLDPTTTATIVYTLDTAPAVTVTPTLDSTLTPPALTTEIEAADASNLTVNAAFTKNGRTVFGPSDSFNVGALVPVPETPGHVSVVFVAVEPDQPPAPPA
jgi:hypothetical protein